MIKTAGEAAASAHPSQQRVPQRGEHQALTRFLATQMAALGLQSTYQLARYLRVSQGTAWRLLSDQPREFHEDTLAAIAFAFDLPLTTVRTMACQPSGELTPFQLPAEADQLDRRERALVEEMVWTILAARGRRVTR